MLILQNSYLDGLRQATSERLPDPERDPIDDAVCCRDTAGELTRASARASRRVAPLLQR
jgi:hypothetical protein